MPNRFGPTRLGPPFSKVWQAAHFFAAAAPFSTDAVCNSFSIGSEGAGAASLPPPWLSSFTAISYPGFSGILGEKSAVAVKLVTSRTRQVPRMAPRILLSSKESILDQAPGRKVDFRPSERPRKTSEIRLSPRPPSHVEISVCPCSGNPYKCADFRPIPIIPGLLSTGPDLTAHDRNPHFGADSRPHGGDPPAWQAAARYRRPADDRPCAAPGRGRQNRPRGGCHPHARDRSR